MPDVDRSFGNEGEREESLHFWPVRNIIERGRVAGKSNKRRREERGVSRGEGERGGPRARKRTETNGEACLARLVLATLLSQVQRHASPSS